jgi:ribosome-dependent ATPase
MSQGFSLYGELSVLQNLDLHARLFHLPARAIAPRIRELVSALAWSRMLDMPAAGLPLGIRQRLSLAVAVLHRAGNADPGRTDLRR